MEELNELKNLVMQNLQKNGYLSNIRAQIRSSVFKTIDAQESGGNKPSPFFNENAKVQKLTEDPKGVNCLNLIKDLLQVYEMEHSLTVFSSESNQKGAVKREAMALKNNVQPVQKQPLLYGVLTKFLKNNKLRAPKKQQPKKQPAPLTSAPAPAPTPSSKPSAPKQNILPAQQNESEGQVEQVEEDINRNQSRRFGESEQFGQSQGYDVTVDSLKLQEYDYYEEIN